MNDVALWFVLLALLLLSGSFSASETALFSLTPSDRERAGPAARALLVRPRELLVTVLFGNLVVNVLFFAFAGRLLPGDGGAGDLIGGLIALAAVLVAGEIMPKTVGLRAGVRVARATAPPLQALHGLFSPVRRVVGKMLEAMARLLGASGRERALTSEDLARVLEKSAGHVLAGAEADLLAEIVELEGVRVREIMTPRVDVVFLRTDGSDREEAGRAALERRAAWVPLIEETPDNIAGRVLVRDLLAHPERTPAQLVMPVKFVPEMASALMLLRDFHEDRTAEAVVVDEWGGTAGIVTLEDIFEELVGELRTEGEDRVTEVVPLGEGRYRVAGGLAIREWNEHFGYQVVPWAFETLGGFVSALLGRIPRAGDRVHYGELVMDVHEVRGRRVLSVDIGVSADHDDGEKRDERRPAS